MRILSFVTLSLLLLPCQSTLVFHEVIFTQESGLKC